MKALAQVSRSLLLLCVVLSVMIAPASAQGDAAAVYKAKCAMCHGADGKGDTAMGKAMKLRDLGSEGVQKQTDDQLTAIVSDGKGKMPAYKGKLSDDQIKQLVSFIRSLKKS
jgi:cytochrome c6